jgi:hypothetical protein
MCYSFPRGRNVEFVAMCDYSLHSVATRPAKVGDKLVTAQFANCLTRGFSAIGEPNVAVCLLAGTEIAFEFEGGYGIFRNWKREKKAGGTVACFRQVNIGKPHVHHDALEFPDGKIVMLTRSTSVGAAVACLTTTTGAGSQSRFAFA